MVVLWIALPFLLVAAALWFWPAVTGQGGWAPLSYALYATVVAGIGAVAVLGYLAWIVVRDGLQASTAPAAAAVVLAVGGVAWFFWSRHADEAGCVAAQAFQDELAAMPADARLAAIRDAGRAVSRPHVCAYGAVAHHFGPPGDLPEAEKRAALAALLAAGMPADERLLYRLAVDTPDAEAVRMLVRRRAEAGLEPMPPYSLRALVSAIRSSGDADGAGEGPELRAVLAVWAEETRPTAASVPEDLRRDLDELGALPAD
jgi:hypothetical protein